MKNTKDAKVRDDIVDDVIKRYDGDTTNGSDSSLESEVKKYKSLYDASNKDVDSSLKYLIFFVFDTWGPRQRSVKSLWV